jgi:hypothetical protein
MTDNAEKARTQRLGRLKAVLDKRLDNPAAAIEALMAELRRGDPQTKLWEALHAAAARDAKEQDLATAYLKIATGRRMQQNESWVQADVLMHAADFVQGVIGDAAGAEKFLDRVLEAVPDHAEAFARLKRRIGATGDPRRMLELYALVAASPKPPDDLARQVVNTIVPLPAKTPLSDVACKRLVALVPTDPSVLEALEAHCRKTQRVGLACALIEQAIGDPRLSQVIALKQRRRLIELYTGEADTPAAAISHVEELLEHVPSDQTAHAAAERLLSNREVAPRAAAALQKARRQARSAG